VQDVVLLRDGRVAILDAAGLRYYDDEGRYLTTAARRGMGPGEYRVAQLFVAAMDTVVVWDGVAGTGS
jgi:hypothetical protein